VRQSSSVTTFGGVLGLLGPRYGLLGPFDLAAYSAQFTACYEVIEDLLIVEGFQSLAVELTELTGQLGSIGLLRLRI
jgi:hypothetical protein